MKPLKDEIKKELAARFRLVDTELVFLAGGREDSDGIVFTALRENKKLVLKISQAVDEEHVKSILEFAHYLGNCGIHISSPIKNQNGNIYEVAKDGDTLLIAKAMKKMKSAIKSNVNSRSQLVASEEDLIKNLNPKITGWKNYYKTKTSKKWMQALDWYIICTFTRWYNKKHQRRNRMSQVGYVRSTIYGKGLKRMAAA